MGKSASKQFAEEVLRTHNEYRRKHRAPGLKLSSKLNREAQQYADALASTRILKHSAESSRGQCGENLAWASYDEPGHFTAMVWKNTKKMGVGKAKATDGSTFVVARYFPAGNIVNQGHFEENVLPPKK
ncbi:Golgi-associated plant pathogenesis-related protein 1 [Acipenser ruthenus]|uniref:Golgi-associated plant pathogenesis-related protein 1 n=1 Tax=Acipenser ruthenus TaxID=7906 RepID=A0A444UGA3_ACIRT|nr:Golgi-associated plant pathogenesis-related protein 1 [Acipenser ruthenus]